MLFAAFIRETCAYVAPRVAAIFKFHSSISVNRDSIYTSHRAVGMRFIKSVKRKCFPHGVDGKIKISFLLHRKLLLCNRIRVPPYLYMTHVGIRTYIHTSTFQTRSMRKYAHTSTVSLSITISRISSTS